MPKATRSRSRSKSKRPVLIMAAWAPELGTLIRALRGRRRTLGNPICLTVGTGAVDAGIGAARAIAGVSPSYVVFVGTAGTYPKASAHVQIGDAVVARRVRL